MKQDVPLIKINPHTKLSKSLPDSDNFIFKQRWH